MREETKELMGEIDRIGDFKITSAFLTRLALFHFIFLGAKNAQLNETLNPAREGGKLIFFRSLMLFYVDQLFLDEIDQTKCKRLDEVYIHENRLLVFGHKSGFGLFRVSSGTDLWELMSHYIEQTLGLLDDMADGYDFLKKEVSYLAQEQNVIRYLEQPIRLPFSYNISCFIGLIEQLKALGDNFEFWADWINDRISGVPNNWGFLRQIRSVGMEVWQGAPLEVNSYLSGLLKAQLFLPLNKVRSIFIGYGESGKTSLIRKLNDEPVVEGKEEMTPGIDVKEWPLPNSDIKAMFWDFGGQVMAHATHQFFLRSRCVYVLLLNARADINANLQAEYWLEHVRAFGGDAPVLLVGNKSDLAQVNLDMNRLTELYPNIRGFFPVSCTKSQGIEPFRDALVEQLQAVGMHQVLFAKTHFGVLQALQAQSPKDPFLPKEAYESLCAEHGVAEDAELNREWLLDLLDALGVIIHFPNIDWLDDYILNPRWLTYGVYRLLYSKQANEQRGRITEREVGEILSQEKVEDNEGNVLTYPRDKVRLIIDAMREFKICYRLPGDDKTLILPDLLPSDRPKDLQFDRDQAMRFDFDFEGFLPRHLMTMFTVQRHEEVVDGLVWQNGVRLANSEYNAQAMAQADYHARRFSLWVLGGQTGRYFSVLRDEVLKILKRMEKLRYEELLWLPDSARVDPERVELGIGDDMRRANYQDLLENEVDGMLYYRCRYGRYDLAKLLGFIPREERLVGPEVHIHTETTNVGDTINIGDINGSNVNFKSNLTNVTQTIQSLPNQDDGEKKQLEALLEELKTGLEELAQQREADAKKIDKRMKQLIEEAAEQEPDQDFLEVTAKGLKEAAEAVAKMVPSVGKAVKGILEILV